MNLHDVASLGLGVACSLLTVALALVIRDNDALQDESEQLRAASAALQPQAQAPRW